MLLGSYLPGTRMGSVCLRRAHGPPWATLRFEDPTPRAGAMSLPPAVLLFQQVGELLTIVGGQQEHGRVAAAPDPVNPFLLAAVSDRNVLLSLMQQLRSGPSPAPQLPSGNSSHLPLSKQSQRADPMSSQPHGPSSGCNKRRTSVGARRGGPRTPEQWNRTMVGGKFQNPRMMKAKRSHPTRGVNDDS